ncbi:MAG: single-stranded DNA-binding protein [Candidatus Binatia bacterium]|nr:single-stranded DNA-binding protein [Candidatus Binatia bacterium]
MSVNKAIIVGNLGADPELRFTPSGRPVANFSVATSSVWKDKASGEKKEDTQWHRIVVWGPQGENCSKYLKKGGQVYVEGEIRTSSYEKDGVKRYSTEIVARDVRFLGGKSGGGGGGGGGDGDFGAPNDPPGGFDSGDGGDIPF